VVNLETQLHLTAHPLGGGSGSTTKDLALTNDNLSGSGSSITTTGSLCYLEGLQNCIAGGGGATCANFYCGEGNRVSPTNVDGSCDISDLQACISGGGGTSCANPNLQPPTTKCLAGCQTPSYATMVATCAAGGGCGNMPAAPVCNDMNSYTGVMPTEPSVPSGL